MDKRLLAFWILVVLLWVGFTKYMEKFHPPPKPKGGRKADVAAKNAPDDEAKPVTKEGEKTDAEKPKKPAVIEPVVPLRDNLALGLNEDSPAAKYKIFATLSNRGAAVTSLQLNRYKDETRKRPFMLLKNPAPAFQSYALDIEQDPEARLDIKTWDVVESDADSILFRTRCMEGRLEIEKRFRLQPESDAMTMEIRLRNLSGEPIDKVSYKLLSGCGLPVEGQWYTQFHRHIHIGMKPANGAPFWSEPTSAEIANAVIAGKMPLAYKETPILCAGVVVQYFGSLVMPKVAPNEPRRIAVAQPIVTALNKTAPHQTDVAVQLTTLPVAIPANGEATHEYILYNGPKEPNALAEFEAYGAPNLIHYGSFLGLPTGQISRFLAWILSKFYLVVRDYGLAIMLLTVCVRSAMFPLSLRQARSMQRMAELQPKIEELKQKYGKDKERLAREQMNLMAREKVNPLGGCLPVLLQLPIFVGLYGALSQNFNLRHSSFLWNMTWIKDLAAPDQLFGFGMKLPVLGPYFNLLPLLAVSQMIWQMKKFSPPATTPEMKMQQKMMMYMTVFMAFMFYLVPAGLCVYFITSGGWTLMERRFLPKPKTQAKPAESAGGGGGGLLGGLLGGDSKPAEQNGAKPATWIKPVESKRETKKDKKAKR